MNNLSYNELLLKLLNNDKEKNLFNNELLLNMYLTLLSLNNKNYHEDMYIKELDIIENFLRKVNNLKVKIQLKRKIEEIELLHNEIKEIYKSNKRLINNYNLNNLEIIKILDTNDPVNLTKLIDNLTKEKMKRANNKERCDNIRNKIINDFPLKEYHIDNDILYIDTISIPLDEFYTIFNYLLNIDNYYQKYANDRIHKLYLKLIGNLINNIIKKKLPDDNAIIPIVLTRFLSQNINYSEVFTNNFNIENIKITDLYSFANNKNISNKTAKWKNISIPNEYLYRKIEEISIKGMYYYDNDKFIIENIENNVSDFKISISIEDMKTFLSQNILNLENQSSKIDWFFSIDKY